jgi:hypothetical protein
LAFIDFVNGENRDEAVSLLKTGIGLTTRHQDFEILLAKVLLTQNRYDEAKVIADELVKTTADAQVKADAEDVLKTVGEYVKARLEITNTPLVRLPWMQPLIFLKRSWLTQTDLAEIDLDRNINNLNIILGRPAKDENRMLGFIEQVTCSDREIVYNIKSGDRRLTMTSSDFKSLRMAVLLEGENSFQIDCGVSFAKTLSVLAFRPTLNVKPQLTSITFVPDFFVLKTPEEMTGMRTVIVEDDTPRKGGGDLKPEARWAAISERLRVTKAGESREAGTIEKIDCSGKSVTLSALAGGKRLRLFSNAPQDVSVAWFTPKASQISFACGGPPLAANALLTFKRTNNATDGLDGELTALEFVPEDFPPLIGQH